MAQEKGNKERQKGKGGDNEQQGFIAGPQPRDEPDEGDAPGQKLDIHGTGQAGKAVVKKSDAQQEGMSGKGEHCEHQRGPFEPFVSGQNARYDGRRAEGVQVDGQKWQQFRQDHAATP